MKRVLSFLLVGAVIGLMLPGMLWAEENCVECHQKESPGMVNDWSISKHAANDVTCCDSSVPAIRVHRSDNSEPNSHMTMATAAANNIAAKAPRRAVARNGFVSITDSMSWTSATKR